MTSKIAEALLQMIVAFHQGASECANRIDRARRRERLLQNVEVIPRRIVHRRRELFQIFRNHNGHGGSLKKEIGVQWR